MFYHYWISDCLALCSLCWGYCTLPYS